ncbi:CRISPR-associated endonuclease Cas2 [Vibrio sp. WXL210]|uniref:CRISPR-associated endonuclease Cas2 n=1 Tax=Vibrio sp. WXL210 TaxID=3450709 RepID=UPI003EC61D8B
MHLYLACFDITDDKSRRVVAKMLGEYGDRVQFSVFEIVVKHTSEINLICNELEDWLEPGDSLRFYHLCVNCRQKSHDAFDEPIATLPAAVVI